MLGDPEVDTKLLLNIPNLLGFVRLFLIILMVIQIRKRPITSFFLCLSSGLVDMIDGRLARYLQQTTKFGAFSDLFIDRLTTQAQMFALASFFPRYSMIFMIVSIIEFSSDMAACKQASFDSEHNPPMVRFYNHLYLNLRFY